MVFKPESISDETEQFGAEEVVAISPDYENRRKTVWERLKGGISSYLAENILSAQGMVVRPYNLDNVQSVRPVESFKFKDTDADVYQSALKVAEQFGWRPGKTKKTIITPYRGVEVDGSSEIETPVDMPNDVPGDADNLPDVEVSVPLFITNRLKKDLRGLGVTDDELYILKPAEAWELLQRKTLEKKLQKQVPEEEVLISAEEATEDFNVLSNMWDEAYEKMQDTSAENMIREIEEITIATVGDIQASERYLDENRGRLSENEVSFIEMSIMMKKIRTKVVEDLTDESLVEDLVTDEVFDTFTQTGEVSEEVVGAIANKIATTQPMTKRELSIYIEKSAEIEAVLRGKLG